jgi:hypothetical protein
VVDGKVIRLGGGSLSVDRLNAKATPSALISMTKKSPLTSGEHHILPGDVSRRGL